MRYLDDVLHRVLRPARYAGGEWNSVVKDWDQAAVRVALSYPDLYEAGANHPTLTVLYDVMNKHPDLLAERAFAPWLDLEIELRTTGLPLFSLETKRSLGDFDLWAFVLDRELHATNVLTMLDLAGVPRWTDQRERPFPLIVGAGSCVRNGEPLAGFFDVLIQGDAEAALLELGEVAQACKQEWAAQGVTPGSAERDALLRRLAALEGVYVPSRYRPVYDGPQFLGMEPLDAETLRAVHCRSADPLPALVVRPVVPFLATVADRPSIEWQRDHRGCCRRCDCAAAAPTLRVRSHEDIATGIEALVRHTGYTEVTLLIPDADDGSDLPGLLTHLRGRFRDRVRIMLSRLPVTAVSAEVLSLLGDGKKGGVTFTPGAANERLRALLGQPLTDHDLLQAIETLFRHGHEHLKLAYQIGVPTETLDDVQEIVALVHQALKVGRQHAGPRARLSVHIGFFLPRAHTQHERAALETAETLAAKLEALQQGLRGKHLKVSHATYEETLLEAVLARGDRRLGPVIARAWELGARFDVKPEQFAWETWERAFRETDIDPAWYAHREREPEETLPWDHLHAGVRYNDLGVGLNTPAAVCPHCGLVHGAGRERDLSPHPAGEGERPPVVLR